MTTAISKENYRILITEWFRILHVETRVHLCESFLLAQHPTKMDFDDAPFENGEAISDFPPLKPTERERAPNPAHPPFSPTIQPSNYCACAILAGPHHQLANVALEDGGALVPGFETLE